MDGDAGDKVTNWLRAHADLRVVGAAVRLSSDREFHCPSMVLFCQQ
jgi:hypothetical protein